jgi:hypothetical protein
MSRSRLPDERASALAALRAWCAGATCDAIARERGVGVKQVNRLLSVAADELGVANEHDRAGRACWALATQEGGPGPGEHVQYRDAFGNRRAARLLSVDGERVELSVYPPQGKAYTVDDATHDATGERGNSWRRLIERERGRR